MPEYWWVNHKQTVRQEIDGGYLWAPKTESNGARSRFYDNLRNAAPGDWVLSYANGSLRYVGRVESFCFSVAKPREFVAGSNWSPVGWWLPVAWQPLNSPVALANIFGEISAFLPSKYSPVNPSSGRGNQKAYLAKIGEEIFKIVIAQGRGLRGLQGIGCARDFAQLTQALDDEAERLINADKALSDTEKADLVRARRGQGLFRKSLMEIERRCRVTLIENSHLLVASHIKPWRSCTTAAERLDGNNGLLLAPHVDRLFDRGLISFRQDGLPMVSSKVDPADLARLGLIDLVMRAAGPFNSSQLQYLAYHRETVFIP